MLKLSTFNLFLVVFLLTAPVSISSAGEKAFVDSEVTHIAYPDWFINSPFLDLKEVLEKARASGKKGLMVLYTTEGCSYCDLFIRESLGDEAIALNLQQNFDSLGMEIFDDAELTSPAGEIMSAKQFAKQQKVEFSPTLLFFGKNGMRILRIVGYQTPEEFTQTLTYVSDEQNYTVTYREFLQRQSDNDAEIKNYPVLKSDPLFSQPPWMLDRSRFPAQHPLLVIFEKTGCQRCENFHTQVLSTDYVRETLKSFDVVRLDIEDVTTPVITPDGERLTPMLWYDKKQFSQAPALMFFEENGKEVLSIDALVLHQRLMNSMNFVLERAYDKGWTYQRFARAKGYERAQERKKQ